jgi:KDO2-lipid IV(A) lauroyltransferase
MKNKKTDLTLADKIIYLPLKILIFIASLLPLWATKPLANFIAFTAHYILRYRLRIVKTNIATSYPNFTLIDINKAIKKFYHHLADNFFQIIRISRMSEGEIKRYMQFENTELIADLLDRGKSIVLYTSHYANWELITSMPLWMDAKYRDNVIFSHVVRPLKNRWFNDFFRRIRSRYNVSVPMKSVMRTLVKWRADEQPFVMGFLADQKPGVHTSDISVKFLGRETPFIEGPELLARKFNLAVCYCDTVCLARNRYKSTIKLMTEDAGSLPPGELTRQYASLLTETINRAPEAYLWSHNRWRLPKHRK